MCWTFIVIIICIFAAGFLVSAFFNQDEYFRKYTEHKRLAEDFAKWKFDDVNYVAHLKIKDFKGSKKDSVERSLNGRYLYYHSDKNIFIPVVFPLIEFYILEYLVKVKEKQKKKNVKNTVSKLVLDDFIKNKPDCQE